MKFNKRDLLTLLLFLIPYSFLSVYLDFKLQSILGYMLGIAFCILLSYLASEQNKLWIIPLGNILSLLTSLIFLNNISSEGFMYYFKPFTPSMLLIILSIVSLSLQLISLYIFNPKK